MNDLLEAAHAVANCLVQSAENGMHDKDKYSQARNLLKSGVPQSQLPKILRVCPSGEAAASQQEAGLGVNVEMLPTRRCRRSSNFWSSAAGR